MGMGACGGGGAANHCKLDSGRACHVGGRQKAKGKPYLATRCAGDALTTGGDDMTDRRAVLHPEAARALGVGRLGQLKIYVHDLGLALDAEREATFLEYSQHRDVIRQDLSDEFP
jgi:hypothetical protein